MLPAPGQAACALAKPGRCASVPAKLVEFNFPPSCVRFLLILRSPSAHWLVALRTTVAPLVCFVVVVVGAAAVGGADAAVVPLNITVKTDQVQGVGLRFLRPIGELGATQSQDSQRTNETWTISSFLIWLLFHVFRISETFFLSLSLSYSFVCLI